MEQFKFIAYLDRLQPICSKELRNRSGQLLPDTRRISIPQAFAHNTSKSPIPAISLVSSCPEKYKKIQPKNSIGMITNWNAMAVMKAYASIWLLPALNGPQIEPCDSAPVELTERSDKTRSREGQDQSQHSSDPSLVEVGKYPGLARDGFPILTIWRLLRSRSIHIATRDADAPTHSPQAM